MNDSELTTQKPLKDEESGQAKKKFFDRRSGWVITTIILVVVVLVAATATGVALGINDRVSLAENQAAPRIQSQLTSARLDIEEGRYEIALSRLDWILDEMAEFLSDEELAEIGELYSQTLVLLASVVTPTPQPSPTPEEPEFTPTPDLRGAEDLFNTARQLMAERAWDDAIQTMQALRQMDLTFRTVQVDGMLYIALRNRGIQKILADGSLEPGIYDLTLAERFAPLDSRAEGLRTWTRLYLTGASFWDVDWGQVVFYFEQVYPHLPNLRDGTFMTATDRFRIGAIEYASQLALAGEYCLAQEYFQRALAIMDDPVVQPTAQWVAEECWDETNQPQPRPPQEDPTPTPANGPTPTPTGPPVEEPTATPTEDPNGND